MFTQMKNQKYVYTEQGKNRSVIKGVEFWETSDHSFISEHGMRNFIDILLNFHETNANFTDKELTDEVISIMFGVSIKSK